MTDPTFSTVSPARFLSLVASIALTYMPGLAGEPTTAQSSSATIDDQPVVLETLEITAHPSGADERTAAVWVLRPSAEGEVATRAADLFATIPGLHLDQAGGAGGRSTLYLRGGEENHTAVLLDGIPLNDPTNSRGGGVDFSLIDPAALASVAVVRGPASMRHGPEAISGVMHLSTHGTGRAEGHRGSVEAGGDGLGRAAFRTEFRPTKTGRASIGATWHAEDAPGGSGDLRRSFVFGSFQHSGVIDLSLSAWGLDHESHAFPDDSGGTRHAVLRTLEERRDKHVAAALQLGHKLDDAAWQATVDAARLDAQTISPGVASGLRDPAGLPASVDDIRLDRLRASLMAERRLAQWIVSVGTDAQREEGDDQAVLDFGGFQIPASFAASRTRVGGFIEAVGPATDRITVSSGFRVDRFDDAGTHATGRVGLLGSIAKQTAWRMNVGTGFKAPSFFGLAHPLVGNPDLRPERGRSAELGLRHSPDHGRTVLDFSLFTSELRNGVDFDPGPPPRVANVAEIRSRGAEMAAIWTVRDDLRVSTSLTYTEATAEPEGTRMRSRPRWRAGLEAQWSPAPHLVLHSRLMGVDRVPDSSIATGDVMLPGWWRVDVSVRWICNEHWSISAACDNVMNHHYEEVVGFTAPGRRARIGLQAQF